MTTYRVEYTLGKAPFSAKGCASGTAFNNFDDAYDMARERFTRWGNASIVETATRTFDLADSGWKVCK